MKVLLTTLNAKYIHTSLALRYLRAVCPPQFDVELREFTINDRVETVAGEIFRHRPDVVAFSCYIWNIDQILAIAAILKKVMPRLVIVAGGPEVSFAPEQWLKRYPALDYIAAGEGEEAFPALLTALEAGRPVDIPGIACRGLDGKMQTAAYQVVERLADIPFPYAPDISHLSGEQPLANRIVYYEASRGCPFSCSYCLSSVTRGVRVFPLDRVKHDLLQLMAAGVRQINFVDRTFNCHPGRAMEIFRFCRDNRQETVFHFEICADLISEEMLAFLLDVPAGLFRFEIGIQSTNPETLRQIRRQMDWERVRHVVENLAAKGNVHLHLDLIAGLPEEGYDSFARSFDDVYRLNPDEIQLGFLKLLRGSALRGEAAARDYLFLDQPPYEVLQSRWLSYSEILRLKLIEDLVEKYFNTGWFKSSLRYLLRHFSGPFALFETMARFWETNQFHCLVPDREELYRRLADFGEKTAPGDWVFLEILKFDYLLNKRAPVLPAFFPVHDPEGTRQAGYRFLSDQDNIARRLPELAALSPKQIGRQSHWETFACDLLDFVEGRAETVDCRRPVTLFFHYPVKARHLPARFFPIPGPKWEPRPGR